MTVSKQGESNRIQRTEVTFPSPRGDSLRWGNNSRRVNNSTLYSHCSGTTLYPVSSVRGITLYQDIVTAGTTQCGGGDNSVMGGNNSTPGTILHRGKLISKRVIK